jgi:hypothetical protein
MKKIVYTQANGVLAIVTPVINTSPVREDITEQQALERAISKLPPEVTSYVLVDEANITTDDAHRNAWVLSSDQTSVVVDTTKI